MIVYRFFRLSSQTDPLLAVQQHNVVVTPQQCMCTSVNVWIKQKMRALLTLLASTGSAHIFGVVLMILSGKNDDTALVLLLYTCSAQAPMILTRAPETKPVAQKKHGL